MNSTKFNRSLSALLLAVLLLHSSLGNTQDCPCPNTPMTDSDFSQYTLNYENLFARPYGRKKHTKWVYLPKNYFLFLDSFFHSTAYTGIRVYFVSHNRILDHRQQSRSDQIMVMIAAGYSNSNMNFDTLYSFHQKVDLLWNPAYHHVELSTRNAPGSSLIGPDHIIQIDGAAIDRYKEQNRQNKYTKWVYICKEQINQVKTFLDSNNSYQGVKLYFGSYNKKIHCLDQGDLQQFTLILLPVENKDSKGDFGKYLEFLKNKFTNNYFNHGSLCPNSCP